jgi:hypothetical protein
MYCWFSYGSNGDQECGVVGTTRDVIVESYDLLHTGN